MIAFTAKNHKAKWHNTQHKSEDEVAPILTLPAQSKAHIEYWKKTTQEGGLLSRHSEKGRSSYTDSHKKKTDAKLLLITRLLTVQHMFCFVFLNPNCGDM